VPSGVAGARFEGAGGAFVAIATRPSLVGHHSAVTPA
jgi:hypothetical protein